MSVVYVVVSMLNGYKNIENVFSTKEKAEAYKDGLEKSFKYDKHELYVCCYNVL